MRGTDLSSQRSQARRGVSRRPARSGTPSFVHEAMLYAGLADFADRSGGFLRDAMREGGPILVAATEEKMEAIREGLGSEEISRVRWTDSGALGRNPARFISVWADLADAAGAGTPVWGIGEPVMASRTADEVVELHRTEALLNLALAGRAARIVCPYDLDALDGSVIDGARRTHPLISDRSGMAVSDSYDEPSEMFDDPLSDRPARVQEFSFDRLSLGRVRRMVGRRGRRFGLAPNRISDLVLSTNEVATNSVRYGGGRGILRVWTQDDSVVCEISDCGVFPTPLAGLVRPTVGREGGYGLWIVNHVCDLVQLRTTTGGVVVRMHVSRG